MKINKNVIKINESQLKQMISESVKMVLKEACWYGDTKPFEMIRSAAEQIMNNFQYTQEDNYESFNDGSYDYDSDIYNWAKKVYYNAEEYISMNSSNSSINCGEDW